mmetsp:Transcript_539/g.1172  ORF Transcript_539/g.1172 Transcript_539/m.1172 type:complete len:491 (+) Transcript_539:155-1627(+)
MDADSEDDSDEGDQFDVPSDDEEGSSVSSDDDDVRDGVSDGARRQRRAGWVETRMCKRICWRKVDREGRFICCACKRRFRSVEHIRRHEGLSEVHSINIEGKVELAQEVLDIKLDQYLAGIDLMRSQIEKRRQGHQMRQHRSHPPEKKQRTDIVSSVGTSTDAVGDSSLPCFGADIIARIASFTNFYTGLMDICIAAGPVDSTVIRHFYLLGNYRYLQNNLKLLVSGMIHVSICAGNIMSWMEVNTEWKKLCTPENIAEFSRVTLQDEATDALTSTIDPKALFNNPAVAVELGLVQVIEHLIQQDGFDVNAYTFNCYAFLEPPNLVALAFGGQTTVLEMLLSVEGINLDLPTFDSDDEFGNTCRLFEVACRNDINCFSLLLKSPKFNANQPIVGQSPFSPPLPLYILLKTLFYDREIESTKLELWWCRFHELLKAGADPRLSVGGAISPLDKVKRWRDNQSLFEIPKRNFKALNEAIELMERLAKMLDEA